MSRLRGSPTPNDQDETCEVCQRDAESCICPECPECGAAGDVCCYANHGLARIVVNRLRRYDVAIGEGNLASTEANILFNIPQSTTAEIIRSDRALHAEGDSSG